MSGFSEVNELADLIKDNLHSKHLVLSAEVVLVDILQDNSCPDRIIEFQPMSPYHRLLLHRLADIYGFAHESVGEGDDRHLVLIRCPDSIIPPILVSDILWQQDDYQSPSTYNHILQKKDYQAPKILHTMSPTAPLEEREAAYQAARKRIFSVNDSNDREVIAPRSRKVPTVARRMIAHALGQNICSASSFEKLSLDECSNKKIAGSLGNEKSNADKSSSVVKSKKAPNCVADNFLSSYNRKEHRKYSDGHGARTANNGVFYKASTIASSGYNSEPSNRREVDLENLEKQRNAAAKRIFSHALGRHSGKGTRDPTSELKQGGK